MCIIYGKLHTRGLTAGNVRAIKKSPDVGPAVAPSSSTVMTKIERPRCAAMKAKTTMTTLASSAVWKQNTVTKWWRHQMETSSVLLAICAGNSAVTGEFPAQRPATRSFYVFFNLRLHKRLSNAPVTSHSRAPYGLFMGCSWAVLNKNRTSTHGARTGPVRRLTNFVSRYGGRRVIMRAL